MLISWKYSFKIWWILLYIILSSPSFLILIVRLQTRKPVVRAQKCRSSISKTPSMQRIFFSESFINFGSLPGIPFNKILPVTTKMFLHTMTVTIRVNIDIYISQCSTNTRWKAAIFPTYNKKSIKKCKNIVCIFS